MVSKKKRKRERLTMADLKRMSAIELAREIKKLQNDPEFIKEVREITQSN